MRAVDFNFSLLHCSIYEDEYKKELILPAGSGISKSTRAIIISTLAQTTLDEASRLMRAAATNTKVIPTNQGWMQLHCIIIYDKTLHTPFSPNNIKHTWLRANCWRTVTGKKFPSGWEISSSNSIFKHLRPCYNIYWKMHDLRVENLFAVICKVVVKFHVFLLIVSPMANRWIIHH